MDFLYILATDICATGLPGAPAKCGGDAPNSLASASEIQKIIAIALGIVGALAFLMVLISGLRYVLSAGDPGNIAKAKNTLIYALVGLAVAVAAESIVVFSINRI